MSGDDEDEGGPYSRIYANLGDLEVTVESNGELDETQEAFEDVWQKRLDEAGKAKDAIRKNSNGYD